MAETKYSPRDMATYFAPFEKKLSNVYKIKNIYDIDKTGRALIPEDGGAFTNDGMKADLVLNGTYVNADFADVHLYLQVGDYKSEAVSCGFTGMSSSPFSLKLTVPDLVSLKTTKIYLKVDGSDLKIQNMKLSVYEYKILSDTTTITGCLTTIANWIRKQN